MAPSPIETLQSAAVAWGVPVAYAICCIVAHRLTAPKEVRVPDHLEPTHEAPPLHPLLLGALWFRRESELHSVENVCEITLAVIVRMIGRGLATFVESNRSEPEAPKEADASRRESLFSRLTQKMPRYNTQFQLILDNLTHRASAPRRVYRGRRYTRPAHQSLASRGTGCLRQPHRQVRHA